MTVNWGDGSANTTFTASTVGSLASQTHTYATAGTFTVAVAVSDANHDASQATFLVNVTGSATATSFTVAGFPASTMAGLPQSITVTAKDINGNTVTTHGGTVQFTSSDSLVALPANYTFVAADNGVHTFSVTLNSPARSITVTDTSTTSITGTQSGIVVTPVASVALTVNSVADNTTADMCLRCARRSP